MSPREKRTYEIILDVGEDEIPPNIEEVHDSLALMCKRLSMPCGGRMCALVATMLGYRVQQGKPLSMFSASEPPTTTADEPATVGEVEYADEPPDNGEVNWNVVQPGTHVICVDVDRPGERKARLVEINEAGDGLVIQWKNKKTREVPFAQVRLDDRG
jgi:hypothetical protein